MQLKNFLKQGFWVLLIRTSGAGLAFISTLVFAQLLGAEQFGLFSLALTFITILGVFVRMGLDNVVLKQVAANLDSQPKVSNGYLYSSVLWTILFGGTVSIFLWLFSDSVSHKIFTKPELSEILKLFSILVVPFSLVFLFSSAFKSFKRPGFALLVQTVIAPLVTLLLIGLVWLYGITVNIEYIILFVISGYSFGLLGYIYFWRKDFINFGIDKQSIAQLLKEGFPMLLISSGALILAWSDTIILGIYATAKEVGIYAVASRVVMVTSLVLIALNAITAPKYALFYRENNIQAIKHLAQQSFLILIATASVPIMFFVFYSEWFMGLFGAQYRTGAIILIILSVGQFVNVSFGSVGYLLSMTGRENSLRNIMLTSSAINIILSIIGVKLYGYVGVAYATAFSTILWNALSLIVVKRHLGFWTISLRLKNEK